LAVEAAFSPLSFFGADESADLEVSLLLGSALLESDLFDSLELLSAALPLLPFRLSVLYQPLPLKITPTGCNPRRTEPPHASHVVSGASEKLWRFSVSALQLAQR